MSSTPASPATAWAASAIWSGVGEVNTCPGQAASSMPWPTKPACRGSCPLPPPETSATFFGFSSRRRTNFRSGPSVMMSACAEASPSKLSASMPSTELMNFFTQPSSSIRASLFLHEGDQAPREFLEQRVELRVPLAAAEIRQVQRQRPLVRSLGKPADPARVSARIGAEKGGLGLRREVADVEDRIEVLNRYRNGIGRIGNLTDEAPVLAHCMGEAQPHSGRALV